MESPLKQFSELQDPRLPRTRRHLLTDIVLIAIDLARAKRIP
jgi:hypothetical protein